MSMSHTEDYCRQLITVHLLSAADRCLCHRYSLLLPRLMLPAPLLQTRRYILSFPSAFLNLFWFSFSFYNGNNSQPLSTVSHTSHNQLHFFISIPCTDIKLLLFGFHFNRPIFLKITHG